MEESGIGVVYQLNREDEKRLMEWLQDGKAIIGETIELRLTDNRNRFDLGTVIARIESWKPRISTPPTSIGPDPAVDGMTQQQVVDKIKASMGMG